MWDALVIQSLKTLSSIISFVLQCWCTECQDEKGRNFFNKFKIPGRPESILLIKLAYTSIIQFLCILLLSLYWFPGCLKCLAFDAVVVKISGCLIFSYLDYMTDHRFPHLLQPMHCKAWPHQCDHLEEIKICPSWALHWIHSTSPL